MELVTLIDQATGLPQIPKIVQELLASFNSQDSDADEIAHKLSQDQALTAKVLRMANSSHFGGNRTIGTVNDAVVLLGLSSLKTLVMASGLTSAIKAPPSVDINEFWRQSFATAGIARWLCQFCNADVDRDLAFTCGMMHNVGAILIGILCPDDAAIMQPLIAQGAQRADLESSRLGFNYAEAGAELAIRWKFPTEMAEAIRHQLKPANAEPEQALAELMFLSNYIAQMNQAEDKAEWMASFPKDSAAKLGIDMVALLDRIDEVDGLDSDFQALLG